MRVPGSIVSQIGKPLSDKWTNPQTGAIEPRTIRGFLVEGNVTFGSSGSPVVLEPPINNFGEPHTNQATIPPLLLGIISEEKITFIHTDAGDQPTFSGLVIVHDADTITDVINLFV